MFDMYNPLSSVQLMGLLNTAKTGNAAADAAMAILLPIAATYAVKTLSPKNGSTSAYNQCISRLRTLIHGKLCTQKITLRQYQSFGQYVSSEGDSRNEYLLRAIDLYIHASCKLDLDNVNVDLSDVAKHKSESSRKEASKSTKRILDKCEIIKKPIQNKWISLGFFKGSEVQMLKVDHLEEAKGGSIESTRLRTTTVTLRSKSNVCIDDFVNKALNRYEAELSKLDVHKRYYFDVVSFSEGGGHKPRCPVYQNYELTGEKTFDTIFSHQTKKLLRIVDDFRLKRGKYGVDGFPYKLGLLLHGEPGTGKTSVIKALAHYLGRHIVNVSLSRIERDQDLRDIFFNREGSQRNLTHEGILFVLEDVDATSKVVTRRKDKPKDDNGDDDHDDSAERKLLDPALVRPGRIDKIIELTYMTAEDAIEMLEHYFSTKMDQKERDQLGKAFELGAIVTPARMERYILEMDTTQEVVDTNSKNKRPRL
ncbi:MAG: hypothetical protein SGARI_003293 [Bacillariaceae sp.]